MIKSKVPTTKVLAHSEPQFPLLSNRNARDPFGALGKMNLGDNAGKVLRINHMHGRGHCDGSTFTVPGEERRGQAKVRNCLSGSCFPKQIARPPSCRVYWRKKGQEGRHLRVECSDLWPQIPGILFLPSYLLGLLGH